MMNPLTCSISPSSLACDESVSRIAICAHDAGASALLVHWISPFIQKCIFFLDGPAVSIFRTLYPSLINNPLCCSLCHADVLITGTSWSSDLEDRARRYSSDLSITSVAVLDHWVNYLPRFNFSGLQVLPNYMWVSDRYAFADSLRLFPDVTCVLLENIWLNELISSVSSLRNTMSFDSDSFVQTILYFLEPIRDEWGDCLGVPEFVVLDYFFANIKSIFNIASFNPDLPSLLRLRPHPSQDISFYTSYLDCADSSLPIEFDLSSELDISLARADLAVGLQSQALVAASACGLKVISVLPPSAPDFCLPHSSILQLRNILS